MIDLDLDGGIDECAKPSGLPRAGSTLSVEDCELTCASGMSKLVLLMVVSSYCAGHLAGLFFGG